MKAFLIAASVVAVALGGCASTPTVSLTYYLPKAETQLQVLQTIDCDSKNNLVVLYSFTPTTTYSADMARSATVDFKRLDGSFANTDTTVNLTDDGRLKGVNAQSTGKGEDTVKAFATLAATAAPLLGAEASDASKAPDAAKAKKTPECQYIFDVGAGKPVSVTYLQPLTFGSSDFGAAKALPFAPGSDIIASGIGSKLPTPQLQVAKIGANAASPGQANYSASGAESPPLFELTLPVVDHVRLDVTDASGSPLWHTMVMVPAAGIYKLPIPKASAFGNHTFALSVADSGAITSLRYAKDTGSTSALNATNSVVGLPAATESAQTAAWKNQADQIVQQQRATTCQAKPADCK